jgi:hypothetical protein
MHATLFLTLSAQSLDVEQKCKAIGSSSSLPSRFDRSRIHHSS